MSLFSYTRGGANGGAWTGVPFWLGVVSNATGKWQESTLRATPTPRVTDGTVGFAATTAIYPSDLNAPTSGSRFFLVFPSSTGIPASLTHVVPRSALTSVSEHLYDTTSGPTGQLRWIAPTVYTSWGSAQDLMYEPASAGLPSAGAHTDYWYSSDPALTRWQGKAGGSNARTLLASSYLEIKPGRRISETWNQSPWLPAAAATPELAGDGGDSPYIAPFMIQEPAAVAARQGDVALLNIQQSDATASNYSAGVDSVASLMSFWRNGVLALTSPSAFQQAVSQNPIGMLLPLLSQAATYRLDLRIAPWTRSGAPDPVTQTDTSWRFRSGPADTAVVPSSQECGPDPAARCTFLPLLFVSYQLPLSPQSQLPAGKPVTFTFTVEHQQGQPAPAGVTATVAASFNDGKTWSGAVRAVALGGGRFRVTLNQPAFAATTGFASLRVTAADQAGDSVTQTLIRAYGLTR